MNNIKMYAAPLEGLTGFAWRRAHKEVFGGADKYYTPFLVANQTHKFKTKELRDLGQEEDNLVPQILTDKAEHFIWAAGQLKDMGYEEVNFNLGCPSGTVVSRGKGSGALKDIDNLDRMLDEIFNASLNIKISIKTRIGFDDKEEFPSLLGIYSKYPVHELTIHPRLRSDFYKGEADRKVFLEALKDSKLTLVYNGDINSFDDEAFGYGCSVMAGRGLIADPALFRKARGGASANIDELMDFHERLIEYYSGYMQGDGPVIHHMKEMWTYFENLFEYDEKTMKKLRKAKSLSEYRIAANAVMKGKMK